MYVAAGRRSCWHGRSRIRSVQCCLCDVALHDLVCNAAKWPGEQMHEWRDDDDMGIVCCMHM
jgi:hypothetical protein